jgi:hypothetical protein
MTTRERIFKEYNLHPLIGFDTLAIQNWHGKLYIFKLSTRDTIGPVFTDESKLIEYANRNFHKDYA